MFGGMRMHDVFGLFGAIGKVRTEPSGCCLRFDAQIEGTAPRRLYYRTQNSQQMLGLLLPENGVLQLSGKCPLKCFDAGGVFTTTRRRWQPMRALDGGRIIPHAVETQLDDCTCIAFAYTTLLPQQVMPYFCFLSVGDIEGEFCWYLHCDKARMPIFRELSL